MQALQSPRTRELRALQQGKEPFLEERFSSYIFIAADYLGRAICDLALRRRRCEHGVIGVEVLHRDPDIYEQFLPGIWCKEIG